MTTTVQVRSKGQFTIPSAMREKLGIGENEVVTVSMIGDGAIVIIPRKLELPRILDKTAEMAKKRGISLEEVLAELDEIRHNS